MKFLIYIGLAVLGFLGSSKFYYFSPAHIEKTLIQHQMNMVSGDADICDFYAENMTVNINHDVPPQPTSIQGGKQQMCEYAKASGAAMKMLQGSISTRIDNMHVTTSFPWLKATATYNETSTVSMQGLPATTMVMNDKVQFKRTLTGLTMTYLSSDGKQSH